MSIAVIVLDRNIDPFLKALKDNTHEKIEVFPDIRNPEEVEVAILWNQPKGYISGFPNLKLICSFGAGVDHIINDPGYAPKIPVTRIVDDDLTNSMCRYVLASTSMFQYGFHFHFHNGKPTSQQTTQSYAPDLTIGILGLGSLGRAAAEMCARCGYRVVGLSNTKKDIPRVVTYIKDEMSTFLEETNILVCMLPLTEETADIIDRKVLTKLKKPAFFINVGRGSQLVEEDLIACLQDEEIGGACLDVVRNEPLQPGNSLLDQPGIIITPHIASVTNQKNAAIQIAKNIEILEKDGDLLHTISSKLGY